MEAKHSDLKLGKFGQVLVELSQDNNVQTLGDEDIFNRNDVCVIVNILCISQNSLQYLLHIIYN